MDDEDKKLIEQLIETHSIESIVNVYIENNCYQPLVQIIMDILEQKLARLNRLEEAFRKE